VGYVAEPLSLLCRELYLDALHDHMIAHLPSYWPKYACATMCAHMERIGIRELRQNASEWIRRAEAGERIEVTKRGRLVAVLGPASADRPLVSLRLAGRLKEPTLGGPLPAAVRTARPASEALAEMRADER
jgi:prevent-host-death family protein